MGLIMHILLGMVLSALGNRGWGSAGVSKWAGVLLMTFGCVIANPALAIWSPVVFGLIVFFRIFASAPWLDATGGVNIWAAIGRSTTILPLVLLAHILTGSSLMMGLFFPVIALFYYVAGKVYPPLCVELAELLTGGYLVGAIAW